MLIKALHLARCLTSFNLTFFLLPLTLRLIFQFFFFKSNSKCYSPDLGEYVLLLGLELIFPDSERLGLLLEDHSRLADLWFWNCSCVTSVHPTTDLSIQEVFICQVLCSRQCNRC